MKTNYKVLVRRGCDLGHKETVLVINWDGLPKFAPAVIGAGLFMEILVEEVRSLSQFDRVERSYELHARTELESLLNQR